MRTFWGFLIPSELRQFDFNLKTCHEKQQQQQQTRTRLQFNIHHCMTGNFALSHDSPDVLLWVSSSPFTFLLQLVKIPNDGRPSWMLQSHTLFGVCHIFSSALKRTNRANSVTPVIDGSFLLHAFISISFEQLFPVSILLFFLNMQIENLPLELPLLSEFAAVCSCFAALFVSRLCLLCVWPPHNLLGDFWPWDRWKPGLWPFAVHLHFCILQGCK